MAKFIVFMVLFCLFGCSEERDLSYEVRMTLFRNHPNHEVYLDSLGGVSKFFSKPVKQVSNQGFIASLFEIRSTKISDELPFRIIEINKGDQTYNFVFHDDFYMDMVGKQKVISNCAPNDCVQLFAIALEEQYLLSNHVNAVQEFFGGGSPELFQTLHLILVELLHFDPVEAKEVECYSYDYFGARYSLCSKENDVKLYLNSTDNFTLFKF